MRTEFYISTGWLVFWMSAWIVLLGLGLFVGEGLAETIDVNSVIPEIYATYIFVKAMLYAN